MQKNSALFYLFILAITFFSGNGYAVDDEKDFFEGKDKQVGFIDLVYSKDTDDIFLHLGKPQLNQKLLFQSSLPRGIGSNDIGLDRGQLGNTRLVEFRRFGNKVLLNQLNTYYRASSNNAAEKASIDEAFADSVIAGFEIVHETSDSIVINYTKFLLSDIHGISDRLNRAGQGGYSIDSNRSGVYQPRTKTFEKNTELEALVTFAGAPKGQYIRDVSPDPKSVTVHLHHSFIELPDDNYKPRNFHPFSGFWTESHMDYSVPIDENMEQKFIPRHRLEKKNPNAEVSEAVEPIIYYLDPGIPEPVMSALKEGAQWWNQAFEAIGYKDGFQVKVLPEDADPMDVRYNVIQWVHRATRGWSYGSSVIDPRTGEIIKGHVTLGSLRVRQDFLIATGFTAPYTGENSDTSKELALALNRIKQLSAHEVGHTIGIAHNFAASENGRASVMDYPHPLIELIDGKVVIENAYDHGIGVWDKFTVAYGYQDFPKNVNEKSALLELVNQAKTDGLLYKSDPDARIPKRASADGHLWDNGANPIDEFKRVSEVRQFALNQFGKNNLPSQETFSDLERRLVPVYYSHRYQLDALVKQISGLNYTYSSKELTNSEFQVSPVIAEKQKEALALLIQSATPEYLALPKNIAKLIPPKAYGSQRTRESMPTRMGIAFDEITAAESISAYSINILLQPERLNRLALQHSNNSDIPSIQDVTKQLFDKLILNNNTDALSQRIKMVTLTVFFDALEHQELAPEVKLQMQNILLSYQDYLNKHKRKLSNKVLIKHLNNYWESGKWGAATPVKPLPPGSPI